MGLPSLALFIGVVAYIIAWFYFLITWLIPQLATPFGSFNWEGLSLWSIIAPLLFIIGGGILLIISIIIAIVIIFDST